MIFDHIREVFIAQHKVDFRMGVFGLRREMNKMDLCPYKGHCCVFVHSNHRQIRVVGASSSGCFLIVKFFEAGALAQKMRFLTDPTCVEISKIELALLFEGGQFSNISKVPDWASCQKANKKVTKSSAENVENFGAAFGNNTF